MWLKFLPAGAPLVGVNGPHASPAVGTDNAGGGS